MKIIQPFGPLAQINWADHLVRSARDRIGAEKLLRALQVGAFTTEAGNNFLDLLLTNANWANIGDATGLVASTSAGSFYAGLHTASPAVGGDQTTNEISYTGYARQAIARSTSGWTVTGLSATNDNEILFGEMTGGAGGTVTYCGLGTASSAAGHLVLFDAVDASLAVTTGVNPRFAASALTVTAA